MDNWTRGLECCGVYYEGWVEDEEEVLAIHGRATVTTYGTRRSSKLPGNSSNDKENIPGSENKVL